MSFDKTEWKRVVLQIALLIITFVTTTLAGAEWAYGRSVFLPDFSWADFQKGFGFSIPLLTILTVHEFGHYFTAVYHRVKTSLPYYIPLPPLPYLPFSLGTFGAVIRLRSKPYSTIQTFDIGIAGPLAGFIVALGFLVYGYASLPPVDYVYQFHPEYAQYGAAYADHVYSQEYYDAQRADKDFKGAVDVTIGKNLLFIIADQFVSDASRVPNMHELMHYPLLLAVYFSLFVTSINLLPVGQLDGGHVVYGLFGFKTHKTIASFFFVAMMFYGGLGNGDFVNLSKPAPDLLIATVVYIALMFFAFLSLGMTKTNTLMLTLLIVSIQFLGMLFMPEVKGFPGWLVLGFLLSRLVGIQHPPSEVEQPLDGKRIVMGWLTLLIFVLCFVPLPLEIVPIFPAELTPQ